MVLQRKTSGNQARNEANSMHLRALFTVPTQNEASSADPQSHVRISHRKTPRTLFGVSIGLRMRGRGHRGRAGHHLLQAVVRIVMIYVLRGYELMLDKHRRRHVPLI